MRAWMSAWALLCMLGAGCAGSGDGDPGDGENGRMLIVAADQLEQVANRYAEYRKSTGYQVEVAITSDLKSEFPQGMLRDSVAARIAAFSEGTQEELDDYVLLIGDADDSDHDNPAFVPVAIGEGGTQPERFTWSEYGDSPYVDLDGDYIPDMHIGRLPFREAAQVEAYLDRVRQYEAEYLPGTWNKTLSAFAGEGGFGELIDGLLEMAAGWVFDEMSYDFDMTMTYASPASEYYLPPALWDADYAERYLEGAVLMPYIGHTLGEVPCCESSEPARRGMLAFFSCSDGSFQEGGELDPHQSLAERVLLREYGPVASMGATTVSHPYGNAVFPRELGHAILDLREETFGKAVTVAKYNMVHRIDSLRESIDSAAEPFCTEPQEDLIQTHIVMYNLLGDPAVPTRMTPGKVVFDDPGNDVSPGDTITISGRLSRGSAKSPVRQGDITVTIESIRSVIPGELEPREPENHDPDLCTRNHGVANDKVIAESSGVVTGSQFTVQLDIPADLSAGTYYLKGYAWNQELDAAGSEKLQVQ
jgi:hypothetical protein